MLQVVAADPFLLVVWAVVDPWHIHYWQLEVAVGTYLLYEVPPLPPPLQGAAAAAAASV